jgi:hypothetical protein
MPRPTLDRVRLTVLIPRTLREQAHRTSILDGQSIAETVRCALQVYVNARLAELLARESRNDIALALAETNELAAQVSDNLAAM